MHVASVVGMLDPSSRPPPPHIPPGKIIERLVLVAGDGTRATASSRSPLSSQIFAGQRLTGLPSCAILFLVRSREGAI
jgi:hypothetical protein